MIKIASTIILLLLAGVTCGAVYAFVAKGQTEIASFSPQDFDPKEEVRPNCQDYVSEPRQERIKSFGRAFMYKLSQEVHISEEMLICAIDPSSIAMMDTKIVRGCEEGYELNRMVLRAIQEHLAPCGIRVEYLP
jgi:hypothetical protein